MLRTLFVARLLVFGALELDISVTQPALGEGIERPFHRALGRETNPIRLMFDVAAYGLIARNDADTSDRFAFSDPLQQLLAPLRPNDRRIDYLFAVCHCSLLFLVLLQIRRSP